MKFPKIEYLVIEKFFSSLKQRFTEAKRITLLKDRINKLEDAKKEISSIDPYNKERESRKKKLQDSIDEKLSVCREELSIRQKLIDAKTDDEKKILRNQLKDNKEKYPKLYNKGEVASPCTNCIDLLVKDFKSKHDKEKKYREELVKGMKLINTSFLNGDYRFMYRHNQKDDNDKRYYKMPGNCWQPVRPESKGSEQSIILDYLTKKNVKPSDAIESLFTGSEGPIVIECLTAIYIIHYRAILKTIGPDKFNQMFKNGIRISPNKSPILDYFIIEEENKAFDLKKGDWVYFKNHEDYLKRHKNSAVRSFQGENALLMNNDVYEGFGIPPSSEKKLNEELLDAYNKEPTMPDPANPGTYIINKSAQNNFPEVKESDIPGLYINGKIYPVVKPDMEKIFNLENSP